MSTFTDLRDALVTQLQAVPGTATVHARTRFIVDDAKFLEAFGYTPQAGTHTIRGWFVTLDNPALEVEPDLSSFGERVRVYHFKLTGVMGWQDSSNSEGTFLALVEAVLEQLDTATTFGVSGVIVRGFEPVCRLVEARRFGSVLVHWAEITVDIPVEKAFA